MKLLTLALYAMAITSTAHAADNACSKCMEAARNALAACYDSAKNDDLKKKACDKALQDRVVSCNAGVCK
jgi:hypothetical protein